MFDRTGIILYTLDYPACAKFYAEVVGLKILFTTDMLTCFEFGQAYLMVEQEDREDQINTVNGRMKQCLRMNVANVKAMAAKIRSLGVEVDYQEHSWGTVAKFFDPDGNLCAFKDSGTFERQIAAGKPSAPK
ncbi:glyoxalase [Lewinellaceae bacterium SD302]|nr:glyoxalase [Lewinellaceae bacterium SD302]